MKMPSPFLTSVATLVLTGALSLPAAAQSTPTDTPAPRQKAKIVEGDQAAPSADQPAPDAPAKVDDFARVDTDRDGKVSPKEYAASDIAAVDMVAAGKRSGSEAPRGGFGLANNEGRPDRSKYFRQLDTDNDGFLSRGELAVGQALNSRGKK